MRKWWNDLRLCWRCLFGRDRADGPGVFPRRQPNEAPPRKRPEDERAAYEAIRWYGRRKARREIRKIHRRLITDRPDGNLARQIRRIFPGARL
ncbi:MAG: hypothetical protein H6559_08255 [Lewinellaceae bacterium]|nr:hypothetical protein [Lewinellaceae bacterium]